MKKRGLGSSPAPPPPPVTFPVFPSRRPPLPQETTRHRAHCASKAGARHGGADEQGCRADPRYAQVKVSSLNCVRAQRHFRRNAKKASDEMSERKGYSEKVPKGKFQIVHLFKKRRGGLATMAQRMPPPARIFWTE